VRRPVLTNPPLFGIRDMADKEPAQPPANPKAGAGNQEGASSNVPGKRPRAQPRPPSADKPPEAHEEADQSEASSRPASKASQRRNQPPNRNRREDSKLGTMLASPIWQGVAGVLTLVSIIVSVLAVLYARNVEKEKEAIEKANATANVTVSSHYRRDKPQHWTMIATVHNRGPATANVVHVILAATHTMCFSGELYQKPDGSTGYRSKGYKMGAKCPSGSQLVDIRDVSPQEIPGLFARKVTSSKSVVLGLYSGTVENLHPGEMAWIEFSYRTGPDLDKKLDSVLPIEEQSSRTDALRPFVEVFGEIGVKGPNIAVGEQSYAAFRPL
jgi:hypothetical protein